MGDDLMKEVVRSRMEGVEQGRDGAGAIAHDRHFTRITVEQLDVILDPLQRLLLIPKTEVARAFSSSRRHETQWTQPVVCRYDDHVLREVRNNDQ